MPYRRGRKSAAQTPAPRSERIKGSKKNPKGSAASQSSASKIVLSEKTIKALSEKVRDYNKKHKSSVSLNTLKAVFRRGAGAYSSSHRPTITGGAPNSRNAWAMARVNKFLMKKAGKKVKAAYVQDDDLLAKGGNVFDDKQLLKRYKQGKSIGFSAEAHLKAVGLLPRADGTKRKSEKYKRTYARRIGKTYGKGGSITLLAPNGKPSNLTPEQYKLVRTPEFKAWFGDWENDPENASKVVDENGEPLVVWHSSRNEFNTFKTKNVKTSTIQGHSIGAYFSSSQKESKRYGDKTRAFFLNLKKPLDFTDIKEDSGKNGVSKFVERLPISDSLKHSIVYNSYNPTAYKILENADKKENIIAKIKKKNDGIVFYENQPFITFVAFHPNQIKLADGSNTTFDGSNPDIRFENGGETETFYNDDDISYYKRKDALNVSYLNDEEWKLVTSPEFKQWFGNWQSEKPYSSKSKDVSQVRQWMYYGSYLGEPKIVYHASTDWAGKPYKEFFVFEHGHYSRDAGYFGKGFYFGVSESNVKQYGKYIRKFFLNIRNPYKHGFSVSDEGHPIEFAEELGLDHLLYAPDKYKQERPHPTKEFAQAVQDKLISLGYDGIHIDGKDGEQYVAFYPEQIKLADGTNTEFDANNPDIRFAEGGFNDEVIVCSNCLWSWKASESTPEEKYICHKCGHDNTPTMDKITMDVPLFIRLLEFAREDAKDDMELHTLTENALNLGDKMLTMEDYRNIVFSKTTSSKITKSTSEVVNFPTIEQEFAEGGVVVGKRHSEEDEFGTGEKFLVESTGQVVELEGGEGVLCKESMQSKKIYNFDGKKMTGREIASYLNHKYGGVEFANGGQVDEKSVCGCRSMYYHGGELPSATLDSLKGGEAVVTVKTMESKDKFAFQGKQMTPRKILSHINQESGGKKFEEGGIIDLTQHHLKNMNEMVKMVNFTEKIFYF